MYPNLAKLAHFVVFRFGNVKYRQKKNNEIFNEDSSFGNVPCSSVKCLYDELSVGVFYFADGRL